MNRHLTPLEMADEATRLKIQQENLARRIRHHDKVMDEIHYERERLLNLQRTPENLLALEEVCNRLTTHRGHQQHIKAQLKAVDAKVAQLNNEETKQLWKSVLTKLDQLQEKRDTTASMAHEEEVGQLQARRDMLAARLPL